MVGASRRRVFALASVLVVSVLVSGACSRGQVAAPPPEETQAQVTLEDLLSRTVHSVPLECGPYIAGRFSNGDLLLKVIKEATPGPLQHGLYAFSPQSGAVSLLYAPDADREVIDQVVRDGAWAVWIESSGPPDSDWIINAQNRFTGERFEVARSVVGDLPRATPTSYTGMLRGGGSVIAWSCFALNSEGKAGSTLNLFDLATRRHEVLRFLENDGFMRFGSIDAEGGLVAYDVGKPGERAIEGSILLLDRTTNAETEVDRGERRCLSALEWPWVVWTRGDDTVKARHLVSGRNVAAGGTSRWAPTVWKDLVTWLQHKGPLRVLLLSDGKEAVLPWQTRTGGHLVDGLLWWWEEDPRDPKLSVTRYIDLVD